ncbi:MAG: response regulator transcription factor [Lentisphaerales bacterium]|nr:MAG: response regulator transcription factor [Lentisphaerales bacterium]
MRILVAEDDVHTREALVDILENEGYEVVPASTGKEALAAYVKTRPDFVCLDIMMPDVTGYDVCREIRRVDERVPVIFISAKSEEIDKVVGLELGADDYIVKPFCVREIVARIHAVERRIRADRADEPAESVFTMGDLRVVPAELRAYRGSKATALGPRDVKILMLLHENRGKVVSRDMLFDRCWGLNYLPDSRSLDQHISQLRKRIERNPGKPRIILTVHGAGYRFEG